MLKYLVAVTDHLASFSIILGIIFSFSLSRKKFTLSSVILGLILGCTVFGVRMYDPRGMNLILIAFNRKLIVTIAAVSLISIVITLMSFVIRKRLMHLVNIISLSVLILVSLIYLVPPLMQYTREFVYFGESGISTNAMLRALGFTLGLIVFKGGCNPIPFEYEVREGKIFIDVKELEKHEKRFK